VGVGGEDPVVTVVMESGRREDLGQPIEELQGREAQGGPAGGIGLGEDVENLVRAAADQVETVECEKGPGAISDEPLQAFAVGGLDADAGVQAKAAAVIPRQHILRLVGLQEAVASEVAEDPFSHRVLETLQELAGEGGGFVETEAGFWMHRIQSRVTLGFLEESVHDDEVVVVVGIEAGAEAVEKADGPEGGCSWSRGAGLPEGGLEGPEQNVEDSAGGPGPVVKEGSEAFGDGKHQLAHRHVGKDVVHQVGSRFGHALGAAGGAGPPAFAGEGYEEVVAAGRAPGSGEPMSQDAALEVAPELLLHVIRHAVAHGAHGVGFVGQGQVGLQLFPYDAVERGALWPAPAIGLGMGAGRRPGW
jgi:hypothetical protein